MADPTVGVFEMNTFTPTNNVASYFDDDLTVPINFGVGKGKIDSEGFIAWDITAGTGEHKTGVDQTVIIGDQVEEIRGLQATTVNNDRDIHIMGSLKIVVETQEDRTVKDGRTTTIIGSDTISVKGDRDTTIAGNEYRTITETLQLTIIGGETKNEASKLWDYLGDFRGEYGGTDIKVTQGNFSLQYLKGDAQLHNADLSLMISELVLGKEGGVGVETKLAGGDVKLGCIKLISGGVSNKLDLCGS
jgi:hypothetical protein